MSGVLYLLMSAAALYLWSNASCAVCVSAFDIGFWGKPWYLWGAVFYASTAMLAFRLKKHWPVTMIMVTGLIFHASLIYGAYAMTKHVCHYCVGFIITELIAIVAYQFENAKLSDHFLAWGPARSTMFVAMAVFFLNPANQTINGAKAYAMLTPKTTVSSQVVSDSLPAESNENAVTTPAKSTRTISNDNKTVDGDSNFIVYGQDGGQVTLSLKNRPVLLFAWWCPHCDDALKNIAKMPPWKRPYPVAVYLQGNNDDVNIKQKLKANGLSNTPYYVYKDIPPVQGVPGLMWYSNGLQNSYDVSYKFLDDTMSEYVSEPKWGYNATTDKNAPVTTSGAIKYKPVNNSDGVLRYLVGKNSMLAEGKYLETLDAAGKKYDVDPLLLLAITGQEQSFVPRSWPGTEEMVKNPFNVYGSWQIFAPGFGESAMIAAQTVNHLSASCPTWMNPIQWIDSPENPNCRYAEDTNWWKGVEIYYEEFIRINNKQ